MNYLIHIRNITKDADDWIMLPMENIYDVLNENDEYIILDAGVLNDIVDEYDNLYIVNENLKELSDMDADMLIAIGAVKCVSLGHENEAERIQSRYIIDDISDLEWNMPVEEMAARYIAEELNVSWIPGIDMNSETFKNLLDYIEWDCVWVSYQTMGFDLYHEIDSNVHTYIIREAA